MPKPVRAASRFALGAIAALALVFGGLTAPAFADDAPVDPPVSEVVDTSTPVEEGASDPDAPTGDATGDAPAEEDASEPVAESDGDTAQEPADSEAVDHGDGEVVEDSAPMMFQPLSDSFFSLSSTVVDGNVDSGSASWGLSTYLASGNTGRPNPLPSAFVSPASFDTTGLIASWGEGQGSVASDGSATIGFSGTSVNFAKTSGAWLKIADLEATLDAAGNGTVTGVVSYGLSLDGAFPPGVIYDPAQAAQRGPVRTNLLSLSGNTAAQFSSTTDTATWSLLTGSWHADLTAFLAGDVPASIPGFVYAAQVNNAISGQTALPITFQLGVRPPAAATVTTLTASPSVSVATGTAVTLTASVSPVASGTVTFREGSSVLGSPVALNGSGTASVAIGAPSAGSHDYTATFTPSDALAFLGSTGGVAITVSVPPTPAAGSLVWGIKAAFNDYIVNAAAHGSISVSGGARGGSSYSFPQAGGGSWSSATQTGTVPFAGSVHYYGHSGLLDVALSNPSIVVHSASSATLYMSGTAFATLNLAAAGKSVGSGGDVTWSGVPATLTSGGAAAFAGFYNAGDALDPLTFTAGSAASGIGGGTVVVASAQASDGRTPAPTPPATTGVTVVGSTPSQGGTVSIEAAGFQPNEAGILVVIYSDPVLLGAVTADANGVARWTGKLPATLSGVHTLTMQGSVAHGVVVTIAPTRGKAAGACTISEATLTWGFKESFRAYLTSSIAHGEWIVADGATYETPNFSWSGTGSLDPESQTGDVAFDGSVLFTAHDGALQTTIANPRVVLSADGAVLLLDISGTTQSGAEVNSLGVEFATLDLSGVTPEEAGDTLTWNAIPAVLTEAGSATFGTYDAGEALDPLTLSISLPADCGAVAADETPAPEVTTAINDEAAGPDLTWLWWLIGGLVVLAIVIAIIVTVIRRRTAA